MLALFVALVCVLEVLQLMIMSLDVWSIAQRAGGACRLSLRRDHVLAALQLILRVSLLQEIVVFMFVFLHLVIRHESNLLSYLGLVEHL